MEKNQGNDSEKDICGPSCDNWREMTRLAQSREDCGAKNHTSAEEDGDSDTSTHTTSVENDP